MNYLKLPLIALSLTVPLVLGNINPPPVLSAPLIAQRQTLQSNQFVEEGMKYLDNQQWDYALYAFNQAIALDPSNPYGYVGRATTMMSKASEPTLPLVKSIEKDLQTAISLMSPRDDADAYQSLRELLQKIQAYRTLLE